MFIIEKILATALLSVNNCKAEHLPLPVTRQGNWLFVFLFFFILNYSLALHAAPVITVDDSTTKLDLAHHVDALDNPQHSITIADILTSHLIHEFAPIDLTAPDSLKPVSSAFWLRFSIANTSTRPQVFWLTANHTAITRLTLYQPATTNPSEFSTAPDTPIQHADFAPILKEISIPPQSSATFLLDIQAINKNSLNIELIKPREYLPEQIRHSRLFSFFIGILVMLALLNLFFALYRKSMIFLYYSCVLIAYTGIEIAGIGMPRTLFTHFGEWQIPAIITLFYLLNTALLLCTIEYIKSTNAHNKHFNHLIHAQYFNTLFSLLLLVTVDTYIPVILIPLTITVIFILSALIDCYKNHDDEIALGNAIIVALSAILSAIYFLTGHIPFSLALFNDPFLIFLIIIETSGTTVLFLIHSQNKINEEFTKKLIIDIQETRHRAQNDLMQEVSRDMQTPLSGILGMADLLKSSSLTAEQHGKVDTIKNSGQALLNKISDIYFRIQLEKNHGGARKSPFELILLMENCLTSFQLSAENNNIELILQVQPDIPAIVKGDEYRLRQIIIQLIENAIKNTEQGEVLVKLSKNASDANLIQFTITDTGRGISADKISILKRNREKDPENPNKLGISTVQQLLSELKSTLFIQSIEGEGSTFSFSLDLPAVTITAEKNPLVDSILKNKRLLIVDDNHTSSKVIKQQASQWGMKIAEAHTGNEALAMYRAKHNLGETFDAIILDYDMPQVSGIEVAEKISREAGSRPVIIMLAGLSQSPPAEIAKQAGIDVILNKPASQKLLQLTLCNLFQINRKSSTASATHNQQKLHLLVADDNDVIRSVISKMMDSLNVEYKMVSDGKLAFDAVKKERFDVILMDCEMPFMNGFEATQHIHQWQRERNQRQTPVIALTAYTLGEHKTKSIAAGMADYLEKPINLTELEAVLQRYRTQGENH